MARAAVSTDSAGENITAIRPLTWTFFGADDGIRTRDPHLGKVMLYQLSHVRVSGRLRYQSPPETDNGMSAGTALERTSKNDRTEGREHHQRAGNLHGAEASAEHGPNHANTAMAPMEIARRGRPLGSSRLLIGGS